MTSRKLLLMPCAREAAPLFNGTVDLLVTVEPDRYYVVRLTVVDARRSGTQVG